jgi:disulfide oxidoreductase YuzD
MFLANNNIEYEYIDIDRSSQTDREAIRTDILRRGGRLLYPTIIVDDKILLTNPNETKLREVLEL